MDTFISKREKKRLKYFKARCNVCFRKCLLCSRREVGKIPCEFRFLLVAVETVEVPWVTCHIPCVCAYWTLWQRKPNPQWTPSAHLRGQGRHQNSPVSRRRRASRAAKVQNSCGSHTVFICLDLRCRGLCRAQFWWASGPELPSDHRYVHGCQYGRATIFGGTGGILWYKCHAKAPDLFPTIYQAAFFRLSELPHPILVLLRKNRVDAKKY